jgi:hypothetical protein
MRIKSVKAQNFKNFQNIDLDLHDFNVLIGQNASGKSNFIQLFRFIKDIKIQGLDNAISLQGGIDYLRNINLSHSMPLSIEVNLSNLRSYLNATARSRGREKDIRVLNVKYRFTLEFMKRQRNFSVAEDTAVIDLLIVPAVSHAEYIAGLQLGAEDDFVNWIQSNSAQGTVTLSKKGQKVDVISNIPETAGIEVSKDDMPFRYSGKRGKRNLLLEQQYFLFPIANGDALSELEFYDIDPKLPKKAVPLSGRAELEFDGSNLAVVLKNLLRDRETRKRFTSLIVDLLPFAEKLRIESLADQSFLFKLQERYSKENYLPASLLSDGTIGVTALIVALYFERMV